MLQMVMTRCMVWFIGQAPVITMRTTQTSDTTNSEAVNSTSATFLTRGQ